MKNYSLNQRKKEISQKIKGQMMPSYQQMRHNAMQARNNKNGSEKIDQNIEDYMVLLQISNYSSPKQAEINPVFQNQLSVKNADRGKAEIEKIPKMQVKELQSKKRSESSLSFKRSSKSSQITRSIELNNSFYPKLQSKFIYNSHNRVVKLFMPLKTEQSKLIDRMREGALQKGRNNPSAVEAQSKFGELKIQIGKKQSKSLDFQGTNSRNQQRHKEQYQHFYKKLTHKKNVLKQVHKNKLKINDYRPLIDKIRIHNDNKMKQMVKNQQLKREYSNVKQRFKINQIQLTGFVKF